MRNLTAEEWVVVSGGGDTDGSPTDEVTIYASRPRSGYWNSQQHSTWRRYRDRPTPPLQNDNADQGGGEGADSHDPYYEVGAPGGGETSDWNREEFFSMIGPKVADSERAQYFADWFEKAAKSDLVVLKGLVDALIKTFKDMKNPGLSKTIGNLVGMSNNLRDTISGESSARGCGWSFGIDVSNLYREAPMDLMHVWGWKAIISLSPTRAAGNI